MRYVVVRDNDKVYTSDDRLLLDVTIILNNLHFKDWLLPG